MSHSKVVLKVTPRRVLLPKTMLRSPARQTRLRWAIHHLRRLFNRTTCERTAIDSANARVVRQQVETIHDGHLHDQVNPNLQDHAATFGTPDRQPMTAPTLPNRNAVPELPRYEAPRDRPAQPSSPPTNKRPNQNGRPTTKPNGFEKSISYRQLTQRRNLPSPLNSLPRRNRPSRES